MNIDKLMMNYVKFLNESLPSALELVKDKRQCDDILCDWLQASWEMLVESALFYGSRRYLPIYGEGADLGDSSRVYAPDALPTDKICCVSDSLVYDHLSKQMIDVSTLEFENFVSMVGGWYSLYPTIDCVLLSDDNAEYVVAIENIGFELKEV